LGLSYVNGSGVFFEIMKMANGPFCHFRLHSLITS